MKNFRTIVLAMNLVVLALAATLAHGQVQGVTYTTLAAFNNTNTGASPYNPPVLGADGNLYGTLPGGGTNNVGVIYKVSTNGTETTLYTFDTNNGANPIASLVSARDGNFYGVAIGGGTNNQGTIFEITTNGTFTLLYSFGMMTNNLGYALDGANPYGALVQGRDGNFYGVTFNGGTNNAGTVFQFSTNRVLTTLHSFTGTASSDDGAHPYLAPLVEGVDGVFYGTTYAGGTNNAGTIFQITADGILTNLFEFNNTGGVNPYSGLSFGTDGNLYGTTVYGGTHNRGTAFQITTNGVLTTLFHFGGSDGLDYPVGEVFPGNNNTLFGTTFQGGTKNYGAVFQLATNGVLTTLHSFNNGSDGANSYAGVIRDASGNLYGATSAGGNQGGFGTVYSLNVSMLFSTLTVLTSGAGTISPNYNGALLQLGGSYSMTAKAAKGFVFSNWTGGTGLPLTVVTNKTTVRFLMASNLTLQANFLDVTKPTLSITNVKAEMNVSNADFTVKGNAGDNAAVSNVLYSINDTGWSNAITANNWSNWTAAVTLTPGTNTIAAYAVDTSGNVSTTNTLKFFYVINAALTVSINGNGTVSPNDNGSPLQIGRSYSIKATAGTGFAFANWTGGTSLPLNVVTNGTTVRFLMESNLMLQANFVDVTSPTLSITNVKAGMNVSNADFTVKGNAGDNVAVSNVLYALNGGAWSNAMTIINWSNWSAAVTLVPGTNMIAAYAVDASGNVSTTNTLKFVYVVNATLAVSISGLGTLTPDDNGAVLQIGKNYSIKATAEKGFTFSNWTGGTTLPLGVITNGTTVRFLMESNLMLQANFADVTKPMLSITAPVAGQHMSNALANVTGTASDNWKVAGVWYQLNGGTWNQPATTNGWTNWMTTVELQNATNTIAAYAMDLGGNVSTTSTVSFVSSNAFELQLVFTTAQPLTTNGLNFALQVSPKLSGHVEVSTNLGDWMTLTNFVGTNSTIEFTDTEATNLIQRYYRAVIP